MVRMATKFDQRVEETFGGPSGSLLKVSGDRKLGEVVYHEHVVAPELLVQDASQNRLVVRKEVSRRAAFFCGHELVLLADDLD